MLFFRKASSIANKFKFRQAETGLIRAIYSFVIGITPFVIGIMTFMIAICTFVIAIMMFMIGIEFLLQNTQKKVCPNELKTVHLGAYLFYEFHFTCQRPFVSFHKQAKICCFD